MVVQYPFTLEPFVQNSTKNSIQPEEIAKRHVHHMSAFRERLCEQLHLAPLGLTSESFAAHQSDLVPALVMDITQRLRDVYLNAWAIIAGMDTSGAHVYSVAGGYTVGPESCHDQSGFLAIGSGHTQFNSLVVTSGYDTTWNLHDAMLLMYSAKKKAETCPGVGRLTDMFLINQSGFRLFSLAAMDAIEKHYRKLDDAVHRKRREVVEKMVKDEAIMTFR